MMPENIRKDRLEVKMISYKEELKKQREEINRLLAVSESNLRRVAKFPDDKIRIRNSNGHYQYTTLEKGACGQYISVKNKVYIMQCLQKHYERKVNKKLKRLKYELDRFLDNYNFNDIIDIYENASQGRKEMVTPIIESQEEYLEKWLLEHQGDQNSIAIENKKFLTEQGEYVRSKSEKIIADLLHKYDIPYRYEPRIVIKPGKAFCPDFVALNKTTRETYYWEHLGLLDNMEYVEHNLNKIDLYEKNGVFVGDKLIITTENRMSPIDVKIIDEKIKKYLI